jgi:hypothetical protein
MLADAPRAVLRRDLPTAGPNGHIASRATEGKQLMEVFTETVREYRQVGSEKPSKLIPGSAKHQKYSLGGNEAISNSIAHEFGITLRAKCSHNPILVESHSSGRHFQDASNLFHDFSFR